MFLSLKEHTSYLVNRKIATFHSKLDAVKSKVIRIFERRILHNNDKGVIIYQWHFAITSYLHFNEHQFCSRKSIFLSDFPGLVIVFFLKNWYIKIEYFGSSYISYCKPSHISYQDVALFEHYCQFTTCIPITRCSRSNYSHDQHWDLSNSANNYVIRQLYSY